MARGASRIDSTIVERAGKLGLVRGQSSRCLGRLRGRSGEEKGFARLSRVADESDNAIRAARSKTPRRGNVGRGFALTWPSVADDLLFAGLIVFEDEVELIFEEPRPGIRSRTA